jgi:GTPase
MRFVDEVEILLRAGNGGNGCRSFLRQRSRPWGGPDGGNGGRGGHIFLEAVAGKHTLLDLHFHKQYRAENGRNGQGQDRHGRAGKDRVIQVPAGTLAMDPATGKPLKDLRRAGQRWLAAEGGAGGRGNASFATPTNRAPQECEPGGAGEVRQIRCELKLLADVGIVGRPNAGKSTLISAVSSARPKVADYPFTTRVPQLGLVRVDEEESFVLADIPGILPGASQGVGLGLRFLRHIERSSVLLFLVDLSAPDATDPWNTYRELREELAAFSPRMETKQRVLAFNKIDLPLARKRRTTMGLQEDIPVFFVSALRREGMPPLVRCLARHVRKMPERHGPGEGRHPETEPGERGENNTGPG